MRYEQHIRIGVAAHAVVVVLLGIGSSFGPVVVLLGAAGASLPITLVGAAVPDLDEPNSKPYRYFRPAMTGLVAGCAFIVLHANLRYLVTLTERITPSPLAGPLAGELAVTCSLLLGATTYVLVPELLQRTEHRGICHQLPSGLVVSIVLYAVGVLLLAAARVPYPLLIPAVFSLSFFIGFCSHLYVDGLLRERRVYIGRSLDATLDGES